MEKSNKSHFYKIQPEKEEKPSEEDIKLRKLEDILVKLKLAAEHKDNLEKNTHKETIKINNNNKSNYGNPTMTRYKEDRNDQEFLSNFMNIDDHINILPKNMHLLADNDTNQSISSQEKYKNLSNLMLDDKNITEFNFIRNPEERVKLNLYTAFSKKSKELFMNDKNVKQSKNQILFHKINDIHIPKFGFKPENNQNIEKSGSFNSFNGSSDRNNEKPINSEKSIFFMNSDDKKTEKEQNKDYPRKLFTECYFRQEKKGFFHIPHLIKIESKQSSRLRRQKTIVTSKSFCCYRKENKKNQDDTFWDPEIDSDTLSYINHNFICIEDIYNGINLEEKKGINKNENFQNDESEPNLMPIQARELFLDNNNNNNANNFIYDKERENAQGEYDKLKPEKNNINKFIEFIEINPGVIKAEYQVFSKCDEEMKFESKLKNDFKNKINNISEIDLSLFPRNGNLNAKKIERVLRFQKLVSERREIEMSLGPKSSTSEESEPQIKEINKNSQIKINIKEDSDLKDKSNSDIIPKNVFIYEENENHKSNQNMEYSSSENNKNELSKSGKDINIFNFNDDNSKISFSSEKEDSVSKNED